MAFVIYLNGRSGLIGGGMISIPPGKSQLHHAERRGRHCFVAYGHYGSPLYIGEIDHRFGLP